MFGWLVFIWCLAGVGLVFGWPVFIWCLAGWCWAGAWLVFIWCWAVLGWCLADFVRFLLAGCRSPNLSGEIWRGRW